VSDIVYTANGTIVRDVYRDDHRLVVRRWAVFPDICIGCGGPAWGNVLRREFRGFSIWWFVLPPGFDVVADYLFGNHYQFDFPFCASCPPDRLQLVKVCLDSHLAVFRSHINGFPSTFLDSIPHAPPDVAAEVNRAWLQRTFPWLYR
jgi:hypothetical protein